MVMVTYKSCEVYEYIYIIIICVIRVYKESKNVIKSLFVFKIIISIRDMFIVVV